jgi:hypothetical protein
MLDDAWDDSQAEAVTLREKLRANERLAGTLVSGGSLSSVSKNSASQSFAFGRGNVTALEIARGWRMLITIFDQVYTSFAAAGETNTDTAVATEMRRRLVPCREFTNDFSGLTY